MDTFEEDHGTRFVYVRIMDSMEYMMSSNFFSGSSTATYIRDIKLAQKIMKHQLMLPILWKMGNDAPAVKTLRITRLVDPSFYMSSEESFVLIL